MILGRSRSHRASAAASMAPRNANGSDADGAGITFTMLVLTSLAPLTGTPTSREWGSAGDEGQVSAAPGAARLDATLLVLL